MDEFIKGLQPSEHSAEWMRRAQAWAKKAGDPELLEFGWDAVEYHLKVATACMNKANQLKKEGK